MKKLLYILLCAAILTGLTVPPTFAEESSANHGSAATNLSPDSPLANETAEMTAINVDIEWDSMVFSYNAGSRREWNPQTHSYQTSDSGWTDRTATITVTNHSDTGVLVEFIFAGTSGIRGTFTKPRLTLFTANTDLPFQASTQFGIDPDSAAISEDCTLGQITVDIQPIATATDLNTLDSVLTDLLNGGTTELQILLPPNADASMLDKIRTKLNSLSQAVNLTLNGVTTVPESAFDGCQKLRSITLPDGITLEDWAFKDCSNLESVDMPCVQTVGERAFSSCSRLKSVDMPCVVFIQNQVFQDCTALTTANFPSAETVGAYVFDNCAMLTAVSLPKASAIGEYAFRSCEKLPEISLPSLQNISKGLLNSCTSLTAISFGQIIQSVASPWASYVSTGEVILTLNAEQGNIGGKTTKFGENGTFGGQTFKEVRTAE